MYSRGRGGGKIAGWNFGTKVGKRKKETGEIANGVEKEEALRAANT